MKEHPPTVLCSQELLSPGRQGELHQDKAVFPLGPVLERVAGVEAIPVGSGGVEVREKGDPCLGSP